MVAVDLCLPVKRFIQPQEAISKLTETVELLRIEKHPRLLSAATYYLALRAHIDFLSTFNDDLISTSVAWDTRIDLPSCPSMAADVAKYAEKINNPVLRGILRSFTEWTPIFRENFDCACGSGNKFENARWDIMLNHTMHESDGELVVKQFLAGTSVKAEYMKKFLAHHRPNKISQADESIVIILSCENAITSKGDIRAIDFWSSKHVDVNNFVKLIHLFQERGVGQ